MKKLFLLLFAAVIASASFTSCNDDDDDATSIVGSWMWAESDETESEILTFTAEGLFIDQYTYRGESYTDTAIYSYNGSILTLNFEDGVDQVLVTIFEDKMIFDEDEIFFRL